MKSKELIRLLQEQDPSGEIEVCVNNADIYFLSNESAYWDGSLQVLTRDHSKDPYYNLTGGKYVRSGRKIQIYTTSIRDVLWENPYTAVIDYSEISEVYREQTRLADDKIREASRDCDKRCEMDIFFDWTKKKALSITPEADLVELRDESDRFYEFNLSPKDPLKILPTKIDPSGTWNASVKERRQSQWEDDIKVEWTGYWEIHKKGLGSNQIQQVEEEIEFINGGELTPPGEATDEHYNEVLGRILKREQLVLAKLKKETI